MGSVGSGEEEWVERRPCLHAWCGEDEKVPLLGMLSSYQVRDRTLYAMEQWREVEV